MLRKISVLLVAFAMAGAMISCNTIGSSQIDGKTYKTEGWINEDTFQVKAMGVPAAGMVNVVQRKGTAKEAALIMAQKRVIEKFVGSRMEGAAGASNYQSTGIAISKEFKGFVKGGTIVNETYDKDQNCEITYRVEKKGLKKEVMGGATPVK